MNEIDEQFINVPEAKEFMNSLEDPVDRELLWSAFATLTFRMAPNGPTGKFDVLFFMRVMAEFINDRKRLVKVLQGNLGD